MSLCIAYFISPHGFGHASRACAVMSALQEKDSSVRFEIFTQVPCRFFEDSLNGNFTYHSLLTDIGLVQTSPLNHDIDKTLRLLDDFLPFKDSQISALAKHITQLDCKLVICDIAPMGIEVARKAEIPSILIENFTWDWIYESYISYTGINRHIEYLQNIFKSADYHIQTEPVCCYDRKANLITSPISRKIRTYAYKIREKLNISGNKSLAMITMGGIRQEYNFLKILTDYQDVNFIIPGASQSLEIYENIILLPHYSGFFHPDHVNACDAVIGKVGYSTLSEIYHAGVPFGYIVRPDFRESESLVAFTEKYIRGFPITDSEFKNSTWVSYLYDLVFMPKISRNCENGAEQAAEFLVSTLCAGTQKI